MMLLAILDVNQAEFFWRSSPSKTRPRQAANASSAFDLLCYHYTMDMEEEPRFPTIETELKTSIT